MSTPICKRCATNPSIPGPSVLCESCRTSCNVCGNFLNLNGKGISQSTCAPCTYKKKSLNCKACHKPRDGAHRSYCNACAIAHEAGHVADSVAKVRATQQRWRDNNPDKLRAKERKRHLRRHYGMTVEQYNQLLASQGGGCAICGRPQPESPKHGIYSSLAIDHCHTTGTVRGLLCGHCNTAIGSANDDPDRLRAMADYLERDRLTAHVAKPCALAA